MMYEELDNARGSYRVNETNNDNHHKLVKLNITVNFVGDLSTG